MDIALLIYGEETQWDQMSPTERADRFTAYQAFGRELAEAGVKIKYGARLARPEFAADDKRSDEGVLELGGLWLLEVADEEEALMWADRLPCTEGNRVEVRLCDGPGRRPAA